MCYSVTGATNALPGLAEAYVDSALIIIISGQVDRRYTSDNYPNLKIRTLGTAEFSITKVLKIITKYCCTLKNPYDCLCSMYHIYAIDLIQFGYKFWINNRSIFS